MKILFVSAKKKNTCGLSTIVWRQSETLKLLGVDIEHFTIGGGLLGYSNGILRLRSHFYSKEYDLVHAHFGLTGIISSLSKPSKTKLVVSFMGDDIFGIKSSKMLVRVYSKYINTIIRWFALKRFDCNILKSNNMVQYLSGSNNVVIPNGVNFTDFYPVEKCVARETLNLDTNKKYIGFFSNPHRIVKNFPLAEKSMKYLDDKAELLIIDGKDIEELNLYYSAVDVLILTSLHEGSPNVIKEAMACNCLVVSTDVGDVRWVIGDTAGCFITSFEPFDVAEKLNMALEYVEENRVIRGRDRVMKLGIDSKTIANRILAVYSNLMTA